MITWSGDHLISYGQVLSDAAFEVRAKRAGSLRLRIAAASVIAPGSARCSLFGFRQAPASVASRGACERSEQVNSFRKFARFRKIALVSSICQKYLFWGSQFWVYPKTGYYMLIITYLQKFPLAL